MVGQQTSKHAGCLNSAIASSRSQGTERAENFCGHACYFVKMDPASLRGLVTSTRPPRVSSLFVALGLHRCLCDLMNGTGCHHRCRHRKCQAKPSFPLSVHEPASDRCLSQARQLYLTFRFRPDESRSSPVRAFVDQVVHAVNQSSHSTPDSQALSATCLQ